MTWMAAENPYLAPVLPGIAALMLVDTLRTRAAVGPLLLSLVAGSIGILLPLVHHRPPVCAAFPVLAFPVDASPLAFLLRSVFFKFPQG